MLRIADEYSSQLDSEAAARQVRRPAAATFSFWRLSLIVVPIVATLVSTSLLAYFLLVGERAAPQGQPQQVEQQQSKQPPGQEAPRQFAQSEQQPPVVQQANPEPEEWSGPPPPVPNDAVLLTLIRSALTALWQANLTGNYSVLRDMGSRSFKEANTVEKLAQAFAGLRERNIDLSAILLIQPKLYRRPEIGPKGNLRISGFFPTKPELTNFNLMFHPLRNGRWQLLGISTSYEAWPQQPTAKAAPEGAPKPAPEGDEQQGTPAKPGPAQAGKPLAPGPASKKAASEPQTDIRDRIDNPPPAAEEPTPEEKPKEKGFWNPFSR